MNLYKETEECLKENGLSFDDVRYIIGREKFGDAYRIDIKDFIKVASTYDYDEGFGRVNVPLDIKICGDDWWLERYDYDGSECWILKAMPMCPTEQKKLIKFDETDHISPYCVFN